MRKLFGKLKKRSAQGIVEYGLILVLAVVVCVAAISLISQSTGNVYHKTSNAFP